ncbi:hypothetical protein BDP27DRAFT_1406872 [Rhodocollybia butyracea]|uniref:Uncharacterized protein n=1 Tax=Rhodocollybia butyracea TaxID=206335 RepID=A0A9P5PD53_9AGAR|nr:hypothetical protein BDP27DRAFT_1406872 [Rhodocollybia butyracea]
MAADDEDNVLDELKAFPPLYRGNKAELTGCISKATKRKMPEPRYINPTIPTPTDKDEMPDLMKKKEKAVFAIAIFHVLGTAQHTTVDWLLSDGEKAREIDAAMGQYETGFLALLQHLSLSASHLAWWPDVKKAIQVQNDKLDEQDVEDRNIAYLARVEKAALQKGEDAIKKVENARENLAQRTASRRERKVKARKAQAEEQRTKSEPPSSPAANHATVQPPGSSPVRKPSPGQAAAQPLAHIASGEVSSGEGAGKEANKAQVKDGATGEETDWYKTVIGRPL